MRRNNKIDERVFEEFNKICEQYAINNSEDNLNSLLDIYQRLKPNWVWNFNRFNQELLEKDSTSSKILDDFLTIQLPEEYSVKNLKAPRNEEQDLFIDIMQRGRIIHLSNKIAHHFDYIFDCRLKGYMIQKTILPNTPEEYREVKKLVRRIYSSTTKEEIKNKAIRILQSKYKFKDSYFEPGEDLDTLKFPELIQAYNDGMYIKDTEIENVNILAQKYSNTYGKKDISYGLKEEDNFNTLFVMDVKEFGQFSVHIKDPTLIAQIKTKYKMPIYRRETSMLVNYMSDKAKEFVEDSKTDDSMDEERGITNGISEVNKQRVRLMEELKYLDLTKSQKHELGVKIGLSRDELKEIDKTAEER